MKPSLIVHGGAWNIPDESVEACRAGCRKALEAGWEILERGGTALDAVEAAIVVLEDDPVFAAGIGSHLNRDGRVELDAILMDGATLQAGAVAAVQRVRNPIRLARKLLESREHMMLVGAGANQHHVLPRFEQLPRQANGVADALDGSDSAGLERCAVHEDGVEFDAAVAVQVRADASVEDGVVFEYDDGRFHGVKRRAAALEYLPAGLERLPATGAAGLDRFVRDVPGAAVNDQRWFHGQRGIPWDWQALSKRRDRG